MSKVKATIKHRQYCEKIHRLYLHKNPDYTCDDDDSFFAFRGSQHFKTGTPVSSMWEIIMVKVSRVATFMRKGIYMVKDETVQDTLLDLANYLIQLAVYITMEDENDTM